MSHIFVSYSRKNSSCVHAVVQEMQQQDFSIWIDLESIEITTPWLDEIEAAISKAKVFMLFWSKEANASKYVQHEIKIAKKRTVTDDLRIVVVMLDDTDNMPFDHIQGYSLKIGCSPIAIKTMVNNLPSEWRKFSYSKKLTDQHHTIVDDDYASVLFAENSECAAYILGKKDKLLPKKPKTLVIALQFTGIAGSDTLDPVLNSLPSNDTWVLYIKGPVSGKNHSLDNNNPTQWQNCSDFVVETIRAIGSQTTSDLHFFARTPNALFGSVTVPFYRFWHMHFYNFVGTGYKHVIEIPRS